MAIEIGRRYFEVLMMIKNYLQYVNSGGMQELITIYEVRRGTCFYDRCKRKDVRADTAVVRESEEVDERGKPKIKERYFFHKDCLDKLLNDFRVGSLN